MSENRVHVCGTGPRQQVTIEGVPRDDMDGVVNGCQWFGVTDGKPEFIPRYKPLPVAKEDERLLPFFNGGKSYKSIDFDNDDHFLFPSITIQHLCGYNYTPKKYESVAKHLEECGFSCCRSRRGNGGKFWEMWWLPSSWAMKGPLKKFHDGLDKKSDIKTKVKEVINWLCRNSSFGTLDVCCQRAAMAMDD